MSFRLFPFELNKARFGKVSNTNKFSLLDVESMILVV